MQILNLLPCFLHAFFCFAHLQVQLPLMREYVKRSFQGISTPFSPIPKTFSESIHFSSPHTYKTIKKCFLPDLPTEESIKKWNNTTNYLPGVHDKVLEYLSNLIKQEREKGKDSVFNLLFDEIHNKCHTFYDQNTHKFEGCVDLRGDLDDFEIKDESQKNLLAKKSLVFMLVNVNGSFKIPVAYYLCDSLSAQQKYELISNLLHKSSTYNIEIVSLTCDGEKNNVFQK